MPPNPSKPYLNVPKSYLIIQKYGSNKSTYSDFVNPNVVNLPLTEQCLHFPFFRTSCKVLLHWGEPKTSLVPHMKGIWNHTFFTLFVCPFLFLICKKQKVITLFSVFLSRNSTSNTKYENDHVKLRRVRTILSGHFRVKLCNFVWNCIRKQCFFTFASLFKKLLLSVVLMISSKKLQKNQKS